MRLLLCLAEHAGEVVSIDDLLDQVWSGVTVTPDSVYQAVASLREHGLIEIVPEPPGPEGGRPREVIKLLPRCAVCAETPSTGRKP